MSQGVRFPGDSFVRFPPEALPRDVSFTGIRLQFRTFEENGLIFFAASPMSSGGIRQEYIVIQIREGRLFFLFDPQDNPTAVSTNNDGAKAYNDGEWHKIEVIRLHNQGFVEIDEVHTGFFESQGDTTVIGVNDGVYLGGIPRDYDIARPNDVGIKETVTQGFVGCMKNIHIQMHGGLGQWTPLHWTNASEWSRAYRSWEGCPINLDRTAVHFLGRGYLELSRGLPAVDFSKQRPLQIEIPFKMDFPTGVLFAGVNMWDNKTYVIGVIDETSIRSVDLNNYLCFSNYFYD